jgi:hypothetical protein
MIAGFLNGTRMTRMSLNLLDEIGMGGDKGEGEDSFFSEH